MPRGGRRPGAGRKPGVPNKKKSVVSVRELVSGLAPLDVMLKSMRKLYEDGDYANAVLAAARAAPYVHQRFAPTDERAARHDEQRMQGDLFDPTPAAPADAPDPWDKVLN